MGKLRKRNLWVLLQNHVWSAELDSRLSGAASSDGRHGARPPDRRHPLACDLAGSTS